MVSTGCWRTVVDTPHPAVSGSMRSYKGVTCALQNRRWPDRFLPHLPLPAQDSSLLRKRLSDQATASLPSRRRSLGSHLMAQAGRTGVVLPLIRLDRPRVRSHAMWDRLHNRCVRPWSQVSPLALTAKRTAKPIYINACTRTLADDDGRSILAWPTVMDTSEHWAGKLQNCCSASPRGREWVRLPYISANPAQPES